jgi:hypothetical protein
MKDRRNALLWAIGWWLVRRQLKRRAAHAVAGATAGAAARRSQLRAVVAAVALVAALAASFVAWRKLFARADAESTPPEPPEAATDGGASLHGGRAATVAET